MIASNSDFCFLSAHITPMHVIKTHRHLHNPFKTAFATAKQRTHYVNTLCRQEGFSIPLDSNTSASLLQACTNITTLNQLYARVLIHGLNHDWFLIPKFIRMYTIFGSLQNARLLFDRIYKPNISLWNEMAKEYACNGLYEEAIALYRQMQVADIQPDNFTYLIVLKACGSLSALQKGIEIHDQITRRGLESNHYMGNALIDMYAKCRRIDLARDAFDNMPDRDVVSWSAMIAGYSQNEQINEAMKLFHEMQLSDIKPSRVTVLGILSACRREMAGFQQGKVIHNYIIKSGLEFDISVGTALVAMYCKHGSMGSARQVFDKMSARDVIAWSAMISGYAQSGYGSDAVALFSQMQLESVKPNKVTIVSVLPAIAELGMLQHGKDIHDYIIRNGLQSDVSVGTALVGMYAKCGNIDVAFQLFDQISKRDVVAWNAMIAGCVQNGYASEALLLFHQMQLTGMEPNSATIVSLLPACAHLASLRKGECIHAYVIKSGFELDLSVGNAFIGMYGKCGFVEVAHQFFDKMPKRDVISLSTMIAAYTQNGHASEALTLFSQFKLTDMKPNRVTSLSVLHACADIAALQHGKSIHDFIVKNGIELDVSLETALISMYCKCGSIDMARQLFDNMSERDLVSWNTMIDGYGMHGYGKDAFAVFLQMQQMGVKPDHITFTCLLSACSHAGLVDLGWKCFHCLNQDYGITHKMEHYACMVDILGRAGHLDKAQNFIKMMPIEPDSSVWNALLGACKNHCNVELGEWASEWIFELGSKNAGSYVLLSNLYAAAGRWDDVAKVRTMLKHRGLKKIPGCSWIEINKKVHAFVAADRSHPQSEKIYLVLESLAKQMKAAGYVPDTSFVLHDVPEEEKKSLVLSHSEKLAISFGLINTSPGMPIQITKNLRVCGDCHVATKFISKIVRREIILRDTKRFHYFRDGLCSCKDYW